MNIPNNFDILFIIIKEKNINNIDVYVAIIKEKNI